MSKRNQYIRLGVIAAAVLGGFTWWIFSDSTAAIKPEQLQTSLVKATQVDSLFGIPLNGLRTHEKKVTPGDNLSAILQDLSVENSQIQQIVDAAHGVFDVRRLQVGKPYTVFCKKDATGKATCMVYQPGPAEYVVFDWRNTAPQVYVQQKQIEVNELAVGGVINSSLYQSIDEMGLEPSLSYEIAGIFKWSIDFFSLQKGDEFKVIYDEKTVEGQTIGMGNIKAAYFKHGTKEFHAFAFEQNGKIGFYGLDGKSLKSMFLQAPLEFTRISSKFNKKRFHPILKRVKPHLGTDYAAPAGTPVVTVADGIVLEASFSKGNGNYVKIKHNDTYTTQYLHLSKFAKGVKKGSRVNQGDVIGYVGSTGLATGPHLCYRFWKNGQQVDPFQEQFQATEPLENKHLPAFNALKDELLPQLMKAGPVQKSMAEYAVAALWSGADPF